MKCLVAVSVLSIAALAAHLQAHAAEGRVGEAARVAIDQSRVSVYSGAPAVAANADSAGASKPGARQHEASRGKTYTKSPRGPRVSRSPRAAHFFFHDAGSRLIADRDGDTFYSEFRVRFDADSLVGDALVYAKLYLCRVGEDDCWLYHETDDFWIFGESDDDDYFVTTTLDDGFATSEYDVILDLYEVGFDGSVATIGAADSSALALLPLEEVGLDVPIELPGYDILGVSTTLLDDADGDGHYSKFRITFDPDADFDGSFAFVKIWVRAQGGEWIEEHVSEDFLVDASGGADTYSLTADWISGYPTSFYDVQIDMHDAATGLLIAAAGSERPELSHIPLEDQARDRVDNPPVIGGGGATTSRERGGGALAAWLAFALLSLRIVQLRRGSAVIPFAEVALRCLTDPRSSSRRSAAARRRRAGGRCLSARRPPAIAVVRMKAVEIGAYRRQPCGDSGPCWLTARAASGTRRK